MCTFLAQFDWVCIYLKCTFWWVLTNIYRTTIKIETISSPLQVLVPFVGSHLCSPSVGQPLTCFLSLQDCFARIKVLHQCQYMSCAFWCMSSFAYQNAFEIHSSYWKPVIYFSSVGELAASCLSCLIVIISPM